MKSVRVIPCLDVKDGRVVKGVNFENLKDAGDPVELALAYDAQGADELVFLDIAASQQNRQTAIEMVRKVAESVFIPFTVGGGVASVEHARQLLRAGADKVSVNSAAIDRPELISEIASEFGAQCCVVAIDGRKVTQGHYAVHTHGGTVPTKLEVVEWADKAVSLGAGEILLTSMDRDGTQLGFDLEMTKAVTSKVNVPVIASGGVGSLEHFAPAAVEANATGLLASSIFHYGQATVGEVKNHLTSQSVVTRIC